jgi:hypothetical protein
LAYRHSDGGTKKGRVVNPAKLKEMAIDGFRSHFRLPDLITRAVPDAIVHRMSGDYPFLSHFFAIGSPLLTRY